MGVLTERPGYRSTERLKPAPPRLSPSGAPTYEPRRLAWAAVISAVLLFTFTLALSSRTGMWLDEAQTLGFSELPLRELLPALRAEGSPPLYYVLLHWWTAFAGTSEMAARSLSSLFAVAAVGLVPAAAARLGGRRLCMASVFLVGTAPFMHRYATEARMYSLAVLLTVAGFLAVHTALERPNRPALAAVAGATGLLLLTHYWAFFLLASVAAVLVMRARHPVEGFSARRVLGAMGVGSVSFLPWLPTFVFQVRHTGAPWGEAPGAGIYEAALRGFVGGRGEVTFLGFAYLGLFVLGLFGRPMTNNRIVLDPRGQPVARPFAFVVGATLGLGLVVLQLSDDAFAARYAAVVLFPFLILAARGLTMVRSQRASILLVAALGGAGLLQSADEAGAPRTQARSISSVVAVRAEPDDVLAFCPDQLAPAVVRLLPTTMPVEAFPPGGPVTRVDWVDYLSRARNSSPREFAEALDRRAGNNTLWLVWSSGYHGLGRSCEKVFNRLRDLRPAAVRAQAHNYSAFEHAALWRFPSGPDSR